ncbi:MAG: RNA-guided pseudouridylation complex pseudouridine synthase subunit Cbf5 [Methanomicrobiales archaeon]
MTEADLVPEPALLVVDKPRGPSSHQVARWVSEMLGVKAGHAGTLDPGVSGVLVVMLGRAVKLAPLLQRHDKEYICLMRLRKDAPEERVREVARGFVGRIYQRPPRVSAVKRSLRIRRIHAIDILEVTGRDVLFRVECESGTYIRTLCHHLGLAMGTGAQMDELRRTRSAVFAEESARTLHEVLDAAEAAREGYDAPLREMLISPAMAVADLPAITVRDTAVDAVCRGAALAGVGVLSQDPYARRDRVAILDREGRLVAVGEALVKSAVVPPGQPGLCAAPRAVLMEPGTHPRGWTGSGPRSGR